MKYPIDAVTAETFMGHLVAHDRAQRNMIQALTLLLQEAMMGMEPEDASWYDEAKAILDFQKKIKAEHETRMFNAKNGHPDKSEVNVNVSQDIGPIIPIGDNINVPGASIGPEQNVHLNEVEKGFGGEMSEEELARHFGQRSQRAPAKKQRLKDMSTDEINRLNTARLQELVAEAEAEERAQDNSTDIYKIKGRIQNLAVGISGGNLTPVGEMMVNSFVHVVKDLYDFAETIHDKSLKIALTDRIRKHESMPGNLISAAASGVKVKK